MLSLLFDQMFFSAVLYAFFCCTAQFHYPFHFYFQRKLPSLKRIGVNYTCATNAVLPCNIQCGFKHKISSKTAKFKKEKKKNKLAQMLTVSHQLSSLTFISLSALSHSLSLFFCHFLDCHPHKHPYHKLLWSCQPCSLLSIQPPVFNSLFLCLKCCYCFGKAHHDMVLVALAGTLPNQVSICYTYYCGVCRSL